jgi:hypothetical protein
VIFQPQRSLTFKWGRRLSQQADDDRLTVEVRRWR